MLNKKSLLINPNKNKPFVYADFELLRDNLNITTSPKSSSYYTKETPIILISSSNIKNLDYIDISCISSSALGSFFTISMYNITYSNTGFDYVDSFIQEISITVDNTTYSYIIQCPHDSAVSDSGIPSYIADDKLYFCVNNHYTENWFDLFTQAYNTNKSLFISLKIYL